MDIDFIMQLPVSHSHNSICTYVDHLTGQTHLALTNDMVFTEGITDLHYKDIFRHHSIPWKVYSDHGLQFAAHYMRALYKHLGIKTDFTTAYHPQGNGKTEHINQEVKQYLHIFCNQH